MKKIFALCGTQGSGKTTILNNLSAAKYSTCSTAFNQSSRNTVTEMGIKFDHTYYRNPTLVAKFQIQTLLNMIVQNRLTLNAAITGDTPITISDRSYLDLDAYTRVNLGMYPEFESFIVEYSNICKLLASIVYDGIFLLPYPDFKVDSTDNVRPSSEVYRSLIHTNMVGLVKEYVPNLVSMLHFEHYKSPSLRTDTVFQKLRDDNGYKNTNPDLNQRVFLLGLIYDTVKSINIPEI